MQIAISNNNFENNNLNYLKVFSETHAINLTCSAYIAYKNIKRLLKELNMIAVWINSFEVRIVNGKRKENS